MIQIEEATEKKKHSKPFMFKFLHLVYQLAHDILKILCFETSQNGRNIFYYEKHCH